MPSLLDPPAESPATAAMSQAAAERLRSLMAAVRLSFIWFGVKKTLTQEQKSQAADTFGAERDYLSAAKKLLDTSHPAFRAVSSTRAAPSPTGTGISLPYPEPGIRLIRQDDIPTFTVQLTTLQAELARISHRAGGFFVRDSWLVMKSLGDADGVTEGLILQSAKRLTVGFWLWARSLPPEFVGEPSCAAARFVRQARAGASGGG